MDSQVLLQNCLLHCTASFFAWWKRQSHIQDKGQTPLAKWEANPEVTKISPSCPQTLRAGPRKEQVPIDVHVKKLHSRSTCLEPGLKKKNNLVLIGQVYRYDNSSIKLKFKGKVWLVS